MDVDAINAKHLDKLDGTETHVYEAIDTGKPTYVAQMKKNTTLKETLVLKVGAHVMLLMNQTSSNNKKVKTR